MRIDGLVWNWNQIINKSSAVDTYQLVLISENTLSLSYPSLLSVTKKKRDLSRDKSEGIWPFVNARSA